MHKLPKNDASLIIIHFNILYLREIMSMGYPDLHTIIEWMLHSMLVQVFTLAHKTITKSWVWSCVVVGQLICNCYSIKVFFKYSNIYKKDSEKINVPFHKMITFPFFIAIWLQKQIAKNMIALDAGFLSSHINIIIGHPRNK